MQNSVKLLIGVVGIAGLLAFLVPSSIPTPAPPPVEAAPPPPIAAPASPIVDPDYEEPEPAEEQDEEEYFKFGEPTIDGKPFGGGDDDSSTEGGENVFNPPVAQVAAPQPTTPGNPSVPPAQDLTLQVK